MLCFKIVYHLSHYIPRISKQIGGKVMSIHFAQFTAMLVPGKINLENINSRRQGLYLYIIAQNSTIH